MTAAGLDDVAVAQIARDLVRLGGDSTMTSRLPPAFAATEYSLLDLITCATEHQIVIHDPTNQAARPSALTLRPAINYGRERHRFGMNSQTPGSMVTALVLAEGVRRCRRDAPRTQGRAAGW